MCGCTSAEKKLLPHTRTNPLRGRFCHSALDNRGQTDVSCQWGQSHISSQLSCEVTVSERMDLKMSHVCYSHNHITSARGRVAHEKTRWLQMNLHCKLQNLEASPDSSGGFLLACCCIILWSHNQTLPGAAQFLCGIIWTCLFWLELNLATSCLLLSIKRLPGNE